jgi:hypothetical protein
MSPRTAFCTLKELFAQRVLPAFQERYHSA